MKNLYLIRDLLIYWPVLLLTWLVATQPLPAIVVPPDPNLVEWKETNNRDRHLDCLSRVIYWEARGQSKAGQLAVAQVVMNRANDRRFPPDICDVIYQQRNGRCQFSWACTGRRDQEPRDLTAWTEAKSVARDALSNLPDLTGNALYFHDTNVVGWNHLRRTARIDNHIFYRDR